MRPTLSLAILSPAFLILTLFLVPVPSHAAEDDPSDGWNAGVKWVPDWDSAVTQANEEGKPLMLLIHRKWCGACKSLKPKFAASAEIAAKSGELVMVQSADESEYTQDTFSPDGGYVPRILFFRVPAEGEPVFLEQITQREDQYKYFHYDAPSIVKSMGEAVDAVKNAEETKETIEDGKSEL